MDTDSSYGAYAGTFLDLIKEDALPEYLRDYGNWFPRPYCWRHREAFVRAGLERRPWKSQACCRAITLYDNRTPGLFKEEFRGAGVIALNSKTYFCWKDESDLLREDIDKDSGVDTSLAPLGENPTAKEERLATRTKRLNKYSSKGLSKKTNALAKEQFMKVLRSGEAVTGTNRGFVRKDNKTYTYSQVKTGLTCFYAKRKVLADGVSTTYLDV